MRGEIVFVRTELGRETGVVVACSRNPQSFLVRFLDGTEAWFAACRVSTK